MMVPRVRFSPSPRGLLHVETLQTAVFAWALARRLNGDLIQQLDNPDLLAALHWLGVDWDEGVGIADVFGTERPVAASESPETAVSHLLASGLAQTDQQQTWLDLPDSLTVATIHGVEQMIGREQPGSRIVLVENNRFSDLLTTICQDQQQQISHIVAPSQALPAAAVYNHLCQQLGWSSPRWLLLPPLINEAGQPLTATAHSLENSGYLSTALFHFLLLGQKGVAGQATFSKWELRQQFDVERLATEPLVWKASELRHLNQRYLQQIGERELAQQIRPFLEDAYESFTMTDDWLCQLTAVIRPQLYTLEDAIDVAEWAFSDEIAFDPATLHTPPTRPILTRLIAEIARVVLLDEKTAVSILNRLHVENPVWTAAQIDAPIRTALIGTAKEPPIPKILGIIGKQRALTRLSSGLRAAQ